MISLAGLDSYSQHWENTFSSGQFDSYWLNINRIVDSSSRQLRFYDHTTPKMEYGCGIEVPLLQSTRYTNQVLTFSADCQMDSLPKKALFVLTLQQNDQLQLWQAVSLKEFFKKAGKPFSVSLRTRLPGDQLNGGNLKIYLWNPGKENIRTLKMEVNLNEEIVKNQLPEAQVTEYQTESALLFSNAYYSVAFQTSHQQLWLADASGQKLTHPIGFVMMKTGQKKVSVMDFRWELHSIDSTDNQSIFHFVHRDRYCETMLILNATSNSPVLSCQTLTSFKRRISVDRISLMLPFTDDTKRVYRKNLWIDSVFFQKEYYLDHQGISIGNDERNVLLYPGFGLSSLQFSSPHQLLWLNLDLSDDHPQMRYPLKKRRQDVFVDESANSFVPGDSLINNFDLCIGLETEHLPRFMPVPSGFEAAFVWTEHADWTDLSTQRAVNFGNEEITKLQEASGGFAFYRIPVTKSVFYDNPDHITNTEISKGQFTGFHCSLRSDSAFSDFVKQLHVAGFDICLHTPEQYTTKPELLTEALDYMQLTFGSPTWIDHGYNNKAHNNREDFVCDGAYPNTPFFALPLWEKYGIRSFWNPYQEEYHPFADRSFSGNLMVPFPGFGDAFADRMLTSNHYKFHGILWSTSSSLDITEPGLWNYYLSKERLENLLLYHSVYINHVYPAWVDASRNYWMYDENGTIVVRPEFNEALSRLAALRDEGRLWMTTIPKLIDYQNAISEISFTVLTENKVEIRNTGKNTVSGLSFISTTPDVLVHGAQVSKKTLGNELLFWFNLEADQIVVIESLTEINE